MNLILILPMHALAKVYDYCSQHDNPETAHQIMERTI